MISAQLDANSVKNKFDSSVDIVNNSIDIPMISEAKLYPSFPTRQFHIHCFYEPYRFETNGNGGGILLY